MIIELDRNDYKVIAKAIVDECLTRDRWVADKRAPLLINMGGICFKVEYEIEEPPLYYSSISLDNITHEYGMVAYDDREIRDTLQVMFNDKKA